MGWKEKKMRSILYCKNDRTQWCCHKSYPNKWCSIQHRSISLSYKASTPSVFSKGTRAPNGSALTQHQKWMMTSKIQSREEVNKKWDVSTMENSFLFKSEYQDLVCMSDYKINLIVKWDIYFIYDKKLNTNSITESKTRNKQTKYPAGTLNRGATTVAFLHSLFKTSCIPFEQNLKHIPYTENM